MNDYRRQPTKKPNRPEQASLATGDPGKRADAPTLP